MEKRHRYHHYLCYCYQLTYNNNLIITAVNEKIQHALGALAVPRNHDHNNISSYLLKHIFTAFF